MFRAKRRARQPRKRQANRITLKPHVEHDIAWLQILLDGQPLVDAAMRDVMPELFVEEDRAWHEIVANEETGD